MVFARFSDWSLLLASWTFVTTASAQTPPPAGPTPPASETQAAPDTAAQPPQPAPSVAADDPARSSTLPPASAAAANPPGAVPKPPEAPLPNPPPAATPAPPNQLRIELPNGTSIRFGLLWQGQYEARGNSSNDDVTQNFFDSDFADLFKAPTGDQALKSGPGFQTKDAFVTYRAVGDQLKLDAGLMLPPGAHNSLQGGGSIYAWDFFLNTFRHGTVFGSVNNPYGRDLGVQLRGLVLDGHLEYRAGIFQGKRNPPITGAASRNPFRYAARLQINLLDPEPNYFYAGTYLGTKKIVSLGASVDYQHGGDDSYRAFGGDALVDLPVGPGEVTAQVNVLHRNGGSRVNLPKQTAFMAEAGYRFDAIKLSPIGRYERRWGDGSAGNETDVGGGLAFWAFGHTSNLKAFYTRLIPDDPQRAYDQFNVQWQLYFY